MMDHLKYHQFLDIVDVHLKQMSHEELKGFVREIAKRLPEDRRKSFVKLLEVRLFSSENDKHKEISYQINSAKKKLKMIEEGKKCLDSEYNQEWDDWFDSIESEFLFFDPEKLIDDIEDSICLVNKCVDMSLFEEGYELCEILCHLEICSKGDYFEHECSLLSMEDLYKYRLLSGKYDNFAKNYLYLIYRKANHTNFDEMYRFFQKFKHLDVKLRDILIIANAELPEFESFLKSFFRYLCENQDDFVKDILMEIQTMIPDKSVLLENAKKYGKTKPYLYVQCLEMHLSDDKKMLELGLEALDEISEHFVIRSQIGLLTASYAEKLNRWDVCEKCWLEAFRSATNTVNYLRLRILSKHFKDHSSRVKEIIDSLSEKKELVKDAYSYKNEHEKQNLVTIHEYCSLLFFEQQFDRMEKEGMSVKKSLGWSSTFMKTGISFMMLLLYRGTELLSGGKSALKRITAEISFQKKIFYQGDKNDNKSDEEVFYEIFKTWKSEVYLSEKDEKYWLKKVETWIEMRVAGVLGENRRNYYEECASFIAVFGEVVESLGEEGAKTRIIDHYKKEYSRKRSFKNALKGFE